MGCVLLRAGRERNGRQIASERGSHVRGRENVRVRVLSVEAGSTLSSFSPLPSNPQPRPPTGPRGYPLAFGLLMNLSIYLFASVSLHTISQSIYPFASISLHNIHLSIHLFSSISLHTIYLSIYLFAYISLHNIYLSTNLFPSISPQTIYPYIYFLLSPFIISTDSSIYLFFNLSSFFFLFYRNDIYINHPFT